MDGSKGTTNDEYAIIARVGSPSFVKLRTCVFASQSSQSASQQLSTVSELH
jgi:hypothetical protein